MLLHLIEAQRGTMKIFSETKSALLEMQGLVLFCCCCLGFMLRLEEQEDSNTTLGHKWTHWNYLIKDMLIKQNLISQLYWS